MTAPPLPSNLGAFKVYSGANPAANAEVSDTVQTVAGRSVSWILLAVKLTLVQGITQTPQPILQIDDGTTVFYETLASTAAQAVSTTCVYSFADGLVVSGQVGSAAAVHSTAPLPEGILIGPAFRIKTSTLGIGANTDYSSAVYYVCELG